MFKHAQAAQEYIFAGNATITLKSKKTDTHFTYKIRKSEDGKLYFVRLLVSPDEYRYLACIFADRPYHLHHSAKSCSGIDAPSFQAMSYALKNLYADSIPELLEIRHEGSCGRCGRQLTHPESIDRGIGPECAKFMCEAA